MTAENQPIEIVLTLNGRTTTVTVDPTERLLDTLRDRLGFIGTKEGCGEGECGACCVLIDGVPANSCLVPTYQVRGRTVQTIEAIAADHPVVAAMLATGGTQCGACTPGVVVCAAWIAGEPDLLNTHTKRELMAGNLCRCTGYDGIIEGLDAAMDADCGGSSCAF